MTMTSFEPGTCFFDDRRTRFGRAPSVAMPDTSARLYASPRSVIEAQNSSEIESALLDLDAALAAGHHAAGYIAYEAGYALEPHLKTLMPQGEDATDRANALPLLRFWIYDQVELLNAREADQTVLAARKGGHVLDPLASAVGSTDYCKKIDQVLDYIRAGDIYQANFTFPLIGKFKGDALSLFAALRTAQPVAYGAFLRMDEADLLSLSPELFVARAMDQLTTRPMKGTAARGVEGAEDEAAKTRLRKDPKERAENLMIVDLLRNDLSRVCRPGTVEVPHLFEVETYPTLHTMTSDVTGKLVPGRRVSSILKALFPCGSVTGAPKIRAMEIIRELEDTPRGPYTGAIGYLTPEGDFQFNVAIRTLTAFADGTVTYPIGSGVVADSDPAREYDECLLKAQVLTNETAPFDLIETIAWHRGKGFQLLDRHMARLGQSAAHFHRPFNEKDVLKLLDTGIEELTNSTHPLLRVRLTLDPSGELDVTALPLDLPDPPDALPFVLSNKHIDAGDPILQHKTSRRDTYEAELARYQAKSNCREVIFTNQYGELTEGTWTNLFLQQGGQLLTPARSCGLLPGTLRAELIETGRANEAILTQGDLRDAEAVFLGNSVRGLMPATEMRPNIAESVNQKRKFTE